MQTGKTLGQDVYEINVNGSYGKFSEISVLDSAGVLNNKPLVGVNLHYGALDKLNVGISINQALFLAGNLKYQFIGNLESRFASSLGFNAGFNFGAVLFGNFSSYVSVPIYFSYHPSKLISIYLTPRYIATSQYLFSSPNKNTKLGYQRELYRFGGAYGVIIGDRHKVALEVSNFSKDLIHPTQFSVGYLYTFGEKNKPQKKSWLESLFDDISKELGLPL
jgi:hypothetical protein